MSLIRTFEFKRITDGRGELVAIEGERHIPFLIRRFYYIFGVPEETPRGMHAHRNLWQVVITLSGSCRFILDDGERRESVVLDKPNVGLLIEPGVWREMHDFRPDTVVAVLASREYDEHDYIRDYGEFKKFARNRH